MTITKPRVQAGVPAGGEFTAYPHAEPDLTLASPSAEAKALKLVVPEFRHGPSPEHQAAIEHWHGRLQAAGVAGELKILSIDGADSDAGGPTVTGNWRSPEGTDFGFAVDHKNVELGRGIDWNLDAAHLGDNVWQRALDDAVTTAEDLVHTFATLRNRARIADGWANGSIRSNDKFQFAIPERITEGSGHEAGQVEVKAASGDEYIVRMDRGSSEARVYGPHQGQLSDRMAAAFLTDVSEACGGNTGPEELKNALRQSMEAGTGEDW